MWRAVIVITIFLIVLLFVTQNMHTTKVNFPFTKGVEVSTVFLVILSFFLGFATSYFVRFTKDFKNRKK